VTVGGTGAERDIRTAFLGRYGTFEAELVLEILRDAGIFAHAKHEFEEPDHYVYGPIADSERGLLMVDAARINEARTLIAARLPEHLASIEASMDAMERGEETEGTDDEENGEDGD